MKSVKQLLENYKFNDNKRLSHENLFEEDKFFKDETNLIGKGKNCRIKFLKNSHSDQMIALKMVNFEEQKKSDQIWDKKRSR